MVARNALLMLLLAAASGRLRADTVQCVLEAEVTYPAGGGAPVPVCSSKCACSESALWCQGTSYHRIPELTANYQSMVKAVYQYGALTSCTLVPYQTTAQLAEQDDVYQENVEFCNAMAAAEATTAATVVETTTVVKTSTLVDTTPNVTTTTTTTTTTTAIKPTTTSTPTEKTISMPTKSTKTAIPTPSECKQTTTVTVAEETVIIPATTTPLTTTVHKPTTTPTKVEENFIIPATTTTTPTTTTALKLTSISSTTEETTTVPTTTTPTITTTLRSTTIPTTTEENSTLPNTTTITTTATTPTTTTTRKPTTTTKRAPVYSCPTDYKMYSTTKCYKVVPNAVAWTTARDKCVAEGGYLATIGSEAENTFLGGLMTDTIWFGLNNINLLYGRFQYDNGSPVNYTNWYSGEPNNHQLREHCVEIQPSIFKWNDIDCTNKKHYACEKIVTVT